MTLRMPSFALAAALALAGSAALSQSGPQPPAAAAEAWPHQRSDIAPDREVRFGTLPNGLRYAIRRNATPPGEASLRLRIDAGSMHEADDQRGLAHFLEHMVLNGTTNVPEGEFMRRLERHGMRMGADTNASTGHLQTVYMLDLPETDAGTVDTALFLLREIADEAILAASAIESERGIIQSEERTRATPGYRIGIDETNFLLRGLRMPLRMPLGLPEVVASAPRERFVAFYNAYYRPERATVIAVGDFDVDDMEARIRAGFGSWRGEGPAGADPDFGTVAPRRGESRLFVEPGGAARVSLAWVRPADLRPDTAARRAEQRINLLAIAILNRRLSRITSTRSPAPFVSANAILAESAESAEITQLNASVEPGAWRRALAAIDAEQRRLVEHGVSAAELDREITQTRTSWGTQVAGAATRTSSYLAGSLVGTIDRDNVFATPAESLRLFEQAVAGLTPDQINQAARRVFAGEPLLYMTSPTAIEGGEAALLAAYRESRATAVAAPEARQARAWPYTDFGTSGAVAERREIAAPVGATAVRFANGVRLTVKRTAFRDDQVLVSVRFGDGRLAYPLDRPNPGWALAPGLGAGGLGRMPAEEIRESLPSRVFGSGFRVEDDAFMLFGATRPEDLAVQMQVLAAYLTDPGWRPTGWDRVRSLAGMVHNQLASTPRGVFSRDADPLLHDGDRRWALATREEMAASSIADARALLDDPLANAPIEVIVVGDVDVEDAIRQTAATFGALPPRPEAPARTDRIRFPASTPEPVRLTHRGRADQGLAFLAWPTMGFYDDVRQARTLNVLSSVFQLRLTQRIREEQGRTYSPRASHAASEAYAGYGFLSVRIEARPEALAAFLRDAEAIAAELRDRPIEADELRRARRPTVESIQRARTGNGWWIDQLARVQTDPRIAARIASHIADYEAITADELQRAARAFLRPDRAWKLVIVPETPAPAPAP